MFKKSFVLILSLFAITFLHGMEHIVPLPLKKSWVLEWQERKQQRSSIQQPLSLKKQPLSPKKRWLKLYQQGKDAKKRPTGQLEGVKKRPHKRRRSGTSFTTTVFKLPRVSDMLEIQADANGRCFLTCDGGCRIEGESAVQAMSNSDTHYQKTHGVPRLDLPRSYTFYGQTVHEPRSFRQVKAETDSDGETMKIDSDYEDDAAASKEVAIFSDGNGYKLSCTLPCCKGKTFFSSRSAANLTSNYKRTHPDVTCFSCHDQDGSLIRTIEK